MTHKGLHGVSLAPNPFEDVVATEPTAQSSPAETMYATDVQLRLCLETLMYLTKKYNLARYRIMRQINQGNKQLHNYFSPGNKVPVSVLEQLAATFLCKDINRFFELPKGVAPKGLERHLKKLELVNQHNTFWENQRPYHTSTRTE